MRLSNGNNNYPQIFRNTISNINNTNTNTNLANIDKNPGISTLKLGMISRIHTARAGCGSCGRH